MFSDPATIRTELRDRLKPLLPEKWRIIDNLSQAVDTVVASVYFEFTEVSSSVNGTPLDRFTVAAKFDLVVASAGAGDEDGADADLVTLAHALQQCDDIYWDTAKKERLSNGALAWRFPLTLLSTIQE